MRTLPVWEWQRAADGQWFARCESADRAHVYESNAGFLAVLDGWYAVMRVDGTQVHMSEHHSRDEACAALGAALSRAIRLREGPTSGPKMATNEGDRKP